MRTVDELYGLAIENVRRSCRSWMNLTSHHAAAEVEEEPVAAVRDKEPAEEAVRVAGLG